MPPFLWGPPVHVRDTVARVAAALLIVSISVVVYLSATGPRLHELPDQEALIDVFFRIVFVPIMVLLVAWYIASLKLVPARASEYVFLNSLPLSRSSMHRLFLISGMCRFPWVPFCMSVLLWALAVVAPASFLIRLNVLALAVYALLQTAGITLHLVVSLKRAGGTSTSFPAKNSPLIQLGVVMAYAALPVIWILYPGQISGGSFWLVVGACGLIAITLFAVSKHVFESWRGTNVILRSIDMRDGSPRMGYKAWARVLSVALVPLKSNPLLIRNLVRSSREASLGSRFILGLFFVAISFLIAMNNESIQDAATILSGMFYLYAFFVVMKDMDRLGADEELPALIYSMPVTKGQLYLSVFVPMIVWLATIALVQAILVVLAGGGVALAARFVLMSILISLVFCVIGVSSAVGGYPNRTDALKRFLSGMFSLAVLIVILYKYRLVVMVAVVFLSLLSLLRSRLYRT
ncbi:MAG: hypothetical protein OEN01_09460 [Candidatus Krumholzibacteria bacterium]|nr:hypothetical protein [Candidatus Krumholzibacteria bacterium]